MATLVVTLVAYLRQSNGGPSIADQEASVRAWARARRHRIVSVMHDESAELHDRDGLAEALALVGAGQTSGLVVPWLDALADDVIAQEQLVCEVSRLGGRVHAVCDGASSDGQAEHAAARHVIREVLRAAATNEPSIRALRSRANARTNGRINGGAGAPAFGFRVEDGDLRPADGEQTAIARIAQLHAEGATLRQVVRTLDAEGHRPKRAKSWHPETVRRILHRLYK